ncbi:tyrosyl-DNA phosphodiesterase-domain-containing protein [Rhexocercosporidium sp. MPI-PUGE-AT-0058]|nr:tyrosyl-DNA phosphodiesterase-domain-containing protein [Rhexocercosporidium sp. MPI-PUGE-AT-0058]
MDYDLEQALAASRADSWQLEEDRDLQEAIRLSQMGDSSTASCSPSLSPNPLEEDRELQEAIRLSKMDGSSTASGTPTASDSSTVSVSPTPSPKRLGKSKAGSKRKAEDNMGPQNTKRTPLVFGHMRVSSSGSGFMDSLSFSGTIPNLTSPSTAEAIITYPNGALRITRTPGRQSIKNCVNLKDVIQGKSLVSACAFSFFIGEEEFYDHFPLSHSSNAVPIYVGRDVNMDPMTPEACRQAGVSFIGQSGKADKIAKKTMPIIEPKLRDMYSTRLGINYHAFYAWSSGSSHSKILVLVYPKFLRLVITSCNMMNIDTVLGDNHWYIHDLPKRTSRSTSKPSSFEADLLSHLVALGTPKAFIESVQGMYNYSTVKVYLSTSVPGVCSGVKAEKHGLLRLRRVVLGLDLQFAKKEAKQVRLEVCAASIGKLSAKWLNCFNDCALGKESITTDSEDRAVPDLKLFYPTVGDVRSADASSQEAASNMGCHIHPWADAPNAVKRIFHHYQSKDEGKLFHQKLILAYNPQDTDAAPYFVYIGSANFSQSAWGAIEKDKKENKATGDVKLVKLANFECGVVIPGDIVKSLLEQGTLNWRSGIVPYEQSAASYNLPRDKPWNDPRWVVNFDENYQGAS